MDNPRIAPRRSMLGVTLLELMAVVMVIGILGMIAIPSYRQYSIRAQRTEAKTALLQLATNQEKYYLTNRTYGTAAQLIAANLLAADSNSERGTYAITIAGADATTYIATATPRSGGAYDQTADAQCATLTINAQGVRGATGTDPAVCW
jgi:type IV pilus assembly protein PilE